MQKSSPPAITFRTWPEYGGKLSSCCLVGGTNLKWFAYTWEITWMVGISNKVHCSSVREKLKKEGEVFCSLYGLNNAVGFVVLWSTTVGLLGLVSLEILNGVPCGVPWGSDTSWEISYLVKSKSSLSNNIQGCWPGWFTCKGMFT